MTADAPTAAGGWFTEAALPLGARGIRVQFAYDRVRHDQRTPYGHVLVLDTPFHGRVLLLDGIVQTTERDEAVYHEMLVLPAALAHGAPRSALVVGGGDGGALRQLLRLAGMRRVVQVEIDPAVTEVCRRLLPAVSGGAFDDPRVELVHADGARYVAAGGERFDLVVLDLTDPVPGGPAAGLFEAPFLRAAAARLSDGGVLAMQCGSLLLQPAEVAAALAAAREVFGRVRLHHAVVPGYQLSSFGFLVAGERLGMPGAAEWQRVTGVSAQLTPQTYAASTVLPPWLRDRLDAG